MDVKSNLIKNVPPYERNSFLVNEIFKAASKQFETIETAQQNNEYELFIDTAVKALQIHARDLGISIGSGLTLVEQRELITAHYRAVLEQTNEESIKNVASSFSGGTVEINATEKDGVFELKFVDTLGIPSNMDGLKSTLDVIMPAHLELVFKYSYVLIRDISKMTLSEVEGMTLNKFAGGKK